MCLSINQSRPSNSLVDLTVLLCVDSTAKMKKVNVNLNKFLINVIRAIVIVDCIQPSNREDEIYERS